MPNERRGQVEIEIGGKRRPLRFDLNAMALIQKEVGLESVGDLPTIFSRGFSEIRFCLYAGLHSKDPDVTLEQVGAWVAGDDTPLDIVVSRMEEAFALFLRGTTKPPEKPSGEAKAPASA